ncbi:MAG TPA: hypothetical protein PKZ88_08190 [Methanothermobacter sp.]|nr:hypothetical protein [Methanothermobacter sp.]
MNRKNAVITLLLLAILGATIGVGTVSAQENDDIQIIDLDEIDEGLEDDEMEVTDFDQALDYFDDYYPYNSDQAIDHEENGSQSQEAAAGSIPMQPTGIPLLPALISVFMIFSGLLKSAKYKF